MERKRGRKKKPEESKVPASAEGSVVLGLGEATPGQKQQLVKEPGHLPSPAGSRTSIPLGEASVSFSSFTHVEQALKDPGRTSITLRHALIDLRTTMSQEEGQLATINLLVHERKKLMMHLYSMVKREKCCLRNSKYDHGVRSSKNEG